MGAQESKQFKIITKIQQNKATQNWVTHLKKGKQYNLKEGNNPLFSIKKVNQIT